MQNPKSFRATFRAYCYVLLLTAGVCGLAMQVAWARLFMLFFGISAQTTAVVLALVLAGLATGALCIGRYANRFADPLRLAGGLVLLCGLVTAFGTLLAWPLYELIEGLLDQSAEQLPIRQVVIGSLVLFLPNFLLGGVLPSLANGFPSLGQLRPHIGILYGVETLGGAVGGMLAGLWLIHSHGVHTTLWLCAVFCIAVGACPFVLRISDTQPAIRQRWLRSTSTSGTGHPDSDDRLLLLAVLCAGATSLGMEVIWIRLLKLIVGSDIHSYTIVVVSFLLGIAFGATLGRLIANRLSRPLSVFAWIQIGVAGSSLLLLEVFRWLAAGHGQLWLASLGNESTAILGRFALCGGLLLVPTTLIGLGFPVAARFLVRDMEHATTRIGWLYAAGALGNVLGVLLVGFIVIPQLGLQRGLIVLASVAIVSAMIASLPLLEKHADLAAKSRKRRSLQLVIGFVGLIVCGYAGIVRHPPRLGLDYRRKDYEVSYYREGPVNTVTVLRDAEDKEYRSMAVDGVIIGESHGGVDEKQRMLAHLPFVLRPEASEQVALTIGLGTGVLSAELANLPQVSKVVCIELSPAVIEAAGEFSDVTGDVLNHPKVEVVTEDGIHYVRRSTDVFDAIASDAKSLPGHAGNAAFFSTDYYTLCRNHLTPNGLFVQWVSLDTPPPAIRIILRSFQSAFPTAYMGIAPPDSIYLIGAKQQLRLDLGKMQNYLDSEFAAGLRSYGWRDAADFLTLLGADGRAIERWLDPATPVNTLSRPILERHGLATILSSSEQRKRENLIALSDLIDQNSPDLNVPLLSSTQLHQYHQARRLSLHAALTMLNFPASQLETSTKLLEQAIRLVPDSYRIRSLLARLYIHQAETALNTGNPSKAADLYYKATKTQPDNVVARFHFASTLASMGKLRAAETHLRKIVQQDAQHRDARKLLEEVSTQLNQRVTPIGEPSSGEYDAFLNELRSQMKPAE